MPSPASFGREVRGMRKDTETQLYDGLGICVDVNVIVVFVLDLVYLIFI